MPDSYPGNLRVWDGPTVTEDLPASPHGRGVSGPHNPAEFADRLYADEVLNPSSTSPPADQGAEPYTLQWFLDIESQRHSRQGRWIPRLLEFAKHSGETLLGLGNSLGTDWLQYARHGASVVVCNPSRTQLALIRRNFELRGLAGRFLHSMPTALPVDNATIDVVCVTSLLDGIDAPELVADEIYRVLKPGGKVLAVTPAQYDVDFWARIGLPWELLRVVRGTRQDPRKFSGRRLRRLFARFVEPRVHKRQLRRSELPLLWRALPLSVAERLMGHVLVLKAFKPLSAAIAVHQPLAA